MVPFIGFECIIYLLLNKQLLLASAHRTRIPPRTLAVFSPHFFFLSIQSKRFCSLSFTRDTKIIIRSNAISTLVVTESWIIKTNMYVHNIIPQSEALLYAYKVSGRMLLLSCPVPDL